MFGCIVEGKDSFTLTGSVKDGNWKVISFEFNWEGDIIGEKPLGNRIALDVRDLNGKILITGDKNGEFWVSLTGEWEATLGEGAETAIQLLNDGILVGGSSTGVPLLPSWALMGS
ncbi:hypothetical protein DRN48_04620 [Thermococci archaeon]|nr:MAG: hypothetical protein DRN51_07370 [Thermococci archaeon]RLF84831.1 MAG: hypothetical protein DRN48_04620 [Thermococci archaeon]